MEIETFESILKDAGVYSVGLELKILDHYECLRKKLQGPFLQLLHENKQLKLQQEKARLLMGKALGIVYDTTHPMQKATISAMLSKAEQALNSNKK
jgi:hypothetical protein